MKSMDLLMAEHRSIEAMLSVVDLAAARIERGEPVEARLFEDAIDFFSNFADGCHHAKEEDTLFPLLATRGFGPDMSVVAALLAQHEAGRAHVKEMRRSLEGWKRGDPQAALALATAAKAYGELLREHMRIEDEYFYDLAAGLLDAAADQTLLERFEHVESLSGGEHERYERIVAKYSQARSKALA